MRVVTFNGLAIEPDGDLETEGDVSVRRPKLDALFVYLLVENPPGLHRRDTLAHLFWTDLSQDRARAALRTSLSNLRQLVGNRRVVTSGNEETGINPDGIWCDATTFSQAIRSKEKEEWVEALRLYRGPFLRGFHVTDSPEFERWVDDRRTEFARRAQETAWKLAKGAAEAGEKFEAAHWARRGVRLYPFDEVSVRKTIRFLVDLGDHAGAFAVYKHFCRQLDRVFDAEPSDETRAMIAALRTDSV